MMLHGLNLCGITFMKIKIFFKSHGFKSHGDLMKFRRVFNSFKE